MSNIFYILLFSMVLAACNYGNESRVVYDLDSENEALMFCLVGSSDHDVIIGFDLEADYIDNFEVGEGDRHRVIDEASGFLVLNSIVFPKKEAVLEIGIRKELRGVVDGVSYLVTYTEFPVEGELTRVVSSMSSIDSSNFFGQGSKYYGKYNVFLNSNYDYTAIQHSIFSDEGLASQFFLPC